MHQEFIDVKKAYDPVRREVLYYILLEIYIPVKLVRLIDVSELSVYQCPSTQIFV